MSHSFNNRSYRIDPLDRELSMIPNISLHNYVGSDVGGKKNWGGGKLSFLGSTSRSSRFYHSTQLCIIFIQHSSASALKSVWVWGGGIMWPSHSHGGFQARFRRWGTCPPPTDPTSLDLCG